MEKNPTMLNVVAAALIDSEGRILLQKRPETGSMAGLWEFPGGKIEAGEIPEAALVRELHEELGIMVDPANREAAAFASEPLGDRYLLLLLYICREWKGQVSALHAADLAWANEGELDGYDMPPADVPLVKILKKLL